MHLAAYLVDPVTLIRYWEIMNSVWVMVVSVGVLAPPCAIGAP